MMLVGPAPYHWVNMHSITSFNLNVELKCHANILPSFKACLYLCSAVPHINLMLSLKRQSPGTGWDNDSSSIFRWAEKQQPQERHLMREEKCHCNKFHTWQKNTVLLLWKANEKRRRSIPCVGISRLVDRAATRIPLCWVSRRCWARRAPTVKLPPTTIWLSSLVFSCQKPNKNGECPSPTLQRFNAS